MKKILMIVLLLPLLAFAQLSEQKYLVAGDSILTFTSQYPNLEILIIDSATVEADTVVLEKKGLGTGWANVSTLSNITGAVVVSMIPGTGLGGGYYFLEKFGEGSFRLRMTDATAGVVEKKTRVKVTGKP